VSVVVHMVPPVPMHGIEVGAGSQLCSSAAPEPVQLEPHAVLLPPSPDTGTHLPLSHWSSLLQRHTPSTMGSKLSTVHVPVEQDRE
jgi:hypothetical protein